ncbi:hypothetical protein [Paenibacillus pedocola]|uniref:hypothetical protein n=1 Tax=Paenibacillus pedocola TaxID=3242193 RepID=UPI0028772609|nr:hypothetical protein [Paenibacillus typhae]
MQKSQLKIYLFAFTIIVFSGCTNSTPASTKESNSPVVTSKASPTVSIAPTSLKSSPDATPVTTSPDQTQVDSSAAYLTYTNKNLGFSLELPSSWENKYSIEEIDNYVAFLHTDSNLKTRAQGELFVIIRYPGNMTNEQVLLGGGGMRSLVFTTDKYSYVLATPTGVEYSDETEDDYLKMSADIPWILKTVKNIDDSECTIMNP